MKSTFKITIPKPCRENWHLMTPKEKGRFCHFCAKTVIDFTKKSPQEIQEYVLEKKDERICGHFYKKQLDTIVIEIPQITFQQHLSFQKLFILALFLVMGATLFSCQYTDGKKQKIENVVITDTIKTLQKEVNSLATPFKKDSTLITEKKLTTHTITTLGITFCDIEPKKDSTGFKTTDETIEITEVIGEMIDGDIDLTEMEEEKEVEFVLGAIIEELPRFKKVKKVSKEKAKRDFNIRIQQFVNENLMQNLGLAEGKYRIFTRFVIDRTGKVMDIKVKAPHPQLKKEVLKIFEKLPQFIPGKQGGKRIKTSYSLPITFMVE